MNIFPFPNSSEIAAAADMVFNVPYFMGLLPDTQFCGLRMHRECRERFPRDRLQRKPIVTDPGMHHGTCVTHVPWCMSGSPTRGGGGNVPGIPGACAARNFAYLVGGPFPIVSLDSFYMIFHIETSCIFSSSMVTLYPTQPNPNMCFHFLPSELLVLLTATFVPVTGKQSRIGTQELATETPQN